MRLLLGRTPRCKSFLCDSMLLTDDGACPKETQSMELWGDAVPGPLFAS